MKNSFHFFFSGPYEDITISEKLISATEGVAKSVICSVSYKCKKNIPHIDWNYEDMQSTIKIVKLSKHSYSMESNLTFIGGLDDDGKSLMCTAQFSSGKTSDSALLNITSTFFMQCSTFYFTGTLSLMSNIYFLAKK